MRQRRIEDGLVTVRWRLVGLLQDVRGYLRFPLRLRLAGPGRDRVVLFGLPYPGWNAALAEAGVWMATRGVGEVVRIPAYATLVRLLGRGAVVIPIKESHVARLPRGCRSLAPDPAVVSLLSDKAEFSSYLQRAGLAGLAPQARINRHDGIAYPCVLKPLRHSSSSGVVVVNSSEEVAQLIDSWTYRSTGYMVQELVEGSTDYVSFCVCRKGRVLWSVTYRMEMGEIVVRNAGNFLRRDRIETPPSTVRQLETVLTSLDYSGICHVDYKLMPDGALRIFEINPQMGRPLLALENARDLSAAFTCFVAHARGDRDDREP